jgi:pimeloyl-ACP methyl ester carboxylesterase
MSETVNERRGLLAVDDARIEFRRLAAQADGAATIVLLHEGLGCVAMWRDLPERLHQATGREVFVYSRPGFGRSSPRRLPLPLDYHQRDALEHLPRVLDAAGITSAVLIGHSDGGTLALIYAGAVGDSRIRGLVTIAAHVFNEDVTIRGIETTKRAFTAVAGDMRRKLERYHGANVEGAFWGWCDVWLDPAFRQWNVEHYLPGITVPLLVIQGADDPYGTLRQVDAIARQVAGPVETLVVEGGGHAPHVAADDVVVPAITRFLRALGA